MIKGLKKRILLSIWGMTSLVLLVFAGLAFYMNKTTLEYSFEAALNSYSDTVVSKIRLDNTISSSWINSLETSNNVIIDIYDNSHQYSFNGNDSFSTSRDILTERALYEAGKRGIDSSKVTYNTTNIYATYSFDGDNNDNYMCKTVMIPVEGTFIMVSVIASKEVLGQQIRELFLRYLLIFIVSDAVLFGMGYVLSEVAVLPAVRSDKQQKDFIAAVSHELRSPLAVLQAASSTAQITDKNTRLASIVQSEVSRMSALVDDLMILIKADSGNFEIKKEQTDFDLLSLEIYEKLRVLAKEQNRKLDMVLPNKPLPVAYTSPARITQIIIGFFNNACEYSLPGEDIIFGTLFVDSKVRMFIRDKGPGIPDDEKNKVFQRFYRSDKSRTDKSHFGLGLSIAETLAHALDIEIGVLDNDLGGSDFYIQI